MKGSRAATRLFLGARASCPPGPKARNGRIAGGPRLSIRARSPCSQGCPPRAYLHGKGSRRERVYVRFMATPGPRASRPRQRGQDALDPRISQSRQRGISQMGRTPAVSSTYDWPIGVAHLRRQDPALNRIIDIVGRAQARTTRVRTDPVRDAAALDRLPAALRQGGGEHPSQGPGAVPRWPAERPRAARARRRRAARSRPVAVESPLGARPRGEGGVTTAPEPAGARRHGRRSDHRAI